MDEWNAWRIKVKKQQEEKGIVIARKSAQDAKAEKEEVKEWVEELIDVSEEVAELQT